MPRRAWFAGNKEILTKNNQKMKTFVLTCFFAMAVSLNLMQASVTTDIETANKAGKAVFLVVTDAENANTVKAIEIANKAQLQYKNSTVLRMNRSDAANAEFVAKNRLSGAPLPLILVIAPNGVITAGFTTDKATPEALVAAIPSPKKADVQKYLSQGKSVFIVVTNKSMSTKDNVMNTCQQACIEMENNAKMIEISLDDPKEKQFLTELKVDIAATEPMTYVINSKGQITGAFNDDVNSTTLVASAKKVAASGCGPAGCGSGKSCGPAKK
jgi:hypothetical protein